MTDRRSSPRYSLTSRSQGTLQVSHDVYVYRVRAEWRALSAQAIQSGTPLVVTFGSNHGVRSWRARVRGSGLVVSGFEFRYSLSLTTARARRC